MEKPKSASKSGKVEKTASKESSKPKAAVKKKATKSGTNQ
jgi:hypothetical protein